jgi:hypothetical protein
VNKNDDYKVQTIFFRFCFFMHFMQAVKMQITTTSFYVKDNFENETDEKF